MTPMMTAQGTTTYPLLVVSNLSVGFHTRGGVVDAVRGVSFSVRAGETLAILGESGSGKSVTALSLLGLSGPNARVSGRAEFLGTDLISLSESQRRQYRGQRIAMVFQDALAALNPVQTVGAQIGEVFRVHAGASRKEARLRAIEMMDRVRIPGAASRADDHPHQFSGGMRQRIMIAMALAFDPDLLIADEPTTALDVTIQAQIMRLLADLQDENGMGLILITHDLDIGAAMADQVAVMYAGRIVESCRSAELLTSAQHPYTQALLRSAPRFLHGGERLVPITGAPPALTHMPAGCAFHPRCPSNADGCASVRPLLRPIGVRHDAACHYAKDVDAAAN